MARTTNYSKKIEKIKSQLDELGAVINSIQKIPMMQKIHHQLSILRLWILISKKNLPKI